MPNVNRLASIDALRGVVMIVMALDHVRDFFHRAAMSSSPTDLRVTTPLLFMTRWVTHICAPVFMLTAGLGAYFYWQAGRRTKQQLSWFLLTRGVWLIVLELTLMQVAYNFDIGSTNPIFLLVLWVLGACMVALSAAVWLPLPFLLGFSVARIVLHHLFDSVTPRSFGTCLPLGAYGCVRVPRACLWVGAGAGASGGCLVQILRARSPVPVAANDLQSACPRRFPQEFSILQAVEYLLLIGAWRVSETSVRSSRGSWRIS